MTQFVSEDKMERLIDKGRCVYEIRPEIRMYEIR